MTLIEKQNLAEKYAHEMVNSLKEVNEKNKNEYGDYNIDDELYQYFYNSFLKRIESKSL